MIDQDDERRAGRRRNPIFGAIPREDQRTIGHAIIDMAAHETDRKILPRHKTDIDAALIVAVDHHDMGEGIAADRRARQEANRWTPTTTSSAIAI